MHPARTGKETTSNTDVKKMDHAKSDRNKALYCIDKLEALSTVTIKLIEPRIELKPKRCRENSIRSMEQ